MNDCIFCKIVSGEMPGEKIYEDGETIAFLDIKPTNPGHTLVIPKKHYRNVFDAPSETMCAIMATVKHLSAPIRQAVNADAVNLIMNNEPAAGQLVYHAHLHIIPRFEADGFRHWKGNPYKEGEMQVVAEKIKSELEN